MNTQVMFTLSGVLSYDNNRISHNSAERLSCIDDKYKVILFYI